MNCEEFKDALVVRIYGDMPEDREAALQSHAEHCAGCARALARTVNIQSVLEPGAGALERGADFLDSGESLLEPGDDVMGPGAGVRGLDAGVPEPDWEASWRVIREKSRKRSHFFTLPEWSAARWATTAAAVAAVFVFGVMAGRSVFTPQPVEVRTPGTIQGGPVSVASYTESLEPLLIDFVNHRGGAADDDMAEFTRRTAVEMLAQTRMLKRAAMDSGDEHTYFLLEEVELVLISIANIGAHNGDVAGQLKNVIRDKSLIRRLNRLSAENKTI